MHIRAIVAGSALLPILLLGVTSGCEQAPGKTASPAPMAAPASPRPVAAQAAGPRLVVLVVVDQLPSWWFHARRNSFPHGVAHLLQEGVYYPEAAYPYAVTFTAAGHAALGTGAPPSVTGVADNEKWDAENGKEVPAAADPQWPVYLLVTNSSRQPGKPNLASAQTPATKPDEGRSSKALLVGGVADVLKREKPMAKTVTISLKDRSAVFVAGKEPFLAIWFDETQPAMTTSSFYGRRHPATRTRSSATEPHPLDWLSPLAAGNFVSKRLGPTWKDPSGKSTRSHELKAAKDLIPTPEGDALVFDTAIEAIKQESLGLDAEPDFLALSFSAHDYAGHYWGPDSWERIEIFRKFDERLAEFLKQLDSQVGPQGYALVLTSDHGVTPLVETSRAEGYQAHRIHRDAIGGEAEKMADSVLGEGDWIAHVGDNSVHISPAFAKHRHQVVALRAVTAAIRAIPGIHYAVPMEDIRGKCETRTGIEALACHSVTPQDSGQIYFAAAPKSITTKYPSGTNHGSPNPDDRLVPILVYAPGNPRWARPRIVREQVNTLQVAPTLAALLGIPAPPAARARPLP